MNIIFFPLASIVSCVFTMRWRNPKSRSKNIKTNYTRRAKNKKARAMKTRTMWKFIFCSDLPSSRWAASTPDIRTQRVERPKTHTNINKINFFFVHVAAVIFNTRRMRCDDGFVCMWSGTKSNLECWHTVVCTPAEGSWGKQGNASLVVVCGSCQFSIHHSPHSSHNHTHTHSHI